MRKNVCLKATWRQPWRTMLLLLFCAGLTFAFLSQVLQYWVIQDAVADSAGYYHAVGALRTENTEAEDAFPSLSVLEKSEYVDYVNTYVSRYGTMQDVFNTDLNGDLNNHILYLQGTFREITKETEKPLCMYAQKYVPREVAYLTFDITNLFSGHPEMASLWEMRFRMDVTQNRDFMNRLQEELQPGESYLFCAQWKKYYYPQITQPCNTLLPLGTVQGPRLDQAAYYAGDDNQYSLPVAEGDLWDYFYPVPQGFVVDFTDPELADVALALEYLNANEHGVSVIPVKDMATIPHFAENYYLREWRLLTLEDDAARNKVCVVHQGLADRRNLKVGDTLTITIKDLEMYHWGQTYPDWEPNLAGAPEVTESYTIVGTVYSLQKNTDSMQYSEIYIPNCFYPAHFRQTVWAGSCGFVLRNPADKAAFLEESGTQLQELGFRADFVDDGWDAFFDSSQAVLHTSRISALLLGLLLVLGFWLVAFLYQRARRREVAILRSLGTPKGSALGQALLPMGLLGFAGVMAGFVAAYYYGLEKAREAVASLQTAQSLAVRVPLTKLIGLGAAVWCFLLLFEAILLTIPSFCSILPLLQGGKTHGKKSKA